VRERLTQILRCPACASDGTLALRAGRSDAHEVREGELVCAACATRFQVSGGVPDLLYEPPDFVRRERAGLERFAAAMRADGWDRDRILALPDVDLPYWHGQRLAMESLLARAQLDPGARLLDVGANTCWASNIFASRGLEVIALDISTAELQGLATADWFLSGGEVFFERVLSTMFAPALASETFDYVFCCEVLHHNDGAHLRQTLRELFRLLRPGGRLFATHEPLRFPLRMKLDHGREVASFEGNEHVHMLHSYALAARRAGFRVEVVGLPGRGSRPRDYARWAWRQLIRGDGALTMDCTKPAAIRR
jgi:SAM-dependent methyltransferase